MQEALQLCAHVHAQFTSEREGGLGISRRGGVQLEPWQENYVLIPPMRINN